MEDKNHQILNLKQVHPKRHQRNILSHLFFCWEIPIIIKGLREELTEDNLYQPLKGQDSRTLGDKLEHFWQTEISKKNPSLKKALFKAFGLEFLFYGFLFFPVDIGLTLVQPIFLRKLLHYYNKSNETQVTKTQAYLYAFSIVFCTSVYITFFHWSCLGLYNFGLKLQNACGSLIYKKILNLKKQNFQKISVGQIVNLLSNDVYRFDLVFNTLHFMWYAPVKLFIAGIYLNKAFGYTSLVGILVLIMFICIQIYLAKKLSYVVKDVAFKTDCRIRLFNDILNGIEVIKMCTWEKSFSKYVSSARKSEMSEIAKANRFRYFCCMLKIYVSKLSVFFCILTYVLFGFTLTPQYVFPLVTVYENLKESAAMRMPTGLIRYAELAASLRRIQSFLLLDSQESVICFEDTKKDPKLEIKNVSFKWDDTSNVLEKINLFAFSGELIGIVGTAGSGKSTLLQVILGEIKVEGTVKIKGTLSYASQEPWIFPATVKQNILFGEEMNEARYSEVIRVCALEHDLSQFPFGDNTLVGEKGMMLSGGQKSRINLARAVYRNVDIYLLDDPLATVDPYVARHIFDECVTKFLRKKCVVLVTHQTHFLISTRIYRLEMGKCVQVENYQKIVKYDQTKKGLDTVEYQKTVLPSVIKEHRGTGSSSKEYLHYFFVGGNLSGFAGVLFLFGSNQLFGYSIDGLLALWVNNTTNDFFSTETKIYVYVGLMIILISSTFLLKWIYVKFCTRISKLLHNSLYRGIIYSPVKFFNDHSIGRILNRYSKDINSVDEHVPFFLLEVLISAFMIIGAAITISVLNYWMTIPTVVLCLILFLYISVVQPANKSIKRTQGVVRSPIFTHTSSSLQGLTTINALKAEKILQQEFNNYQDIYTSASFLARAIFFTLAFWIDMTCNIYTGVVLFSFIFFSDALMGSTGLAFTTSIIFGSLCQVFGKFWCDLDSQITAVERIKDYADLPPEIDKGSYHPKNSWPDKGNIVFDSVSLRYSDNFWALDNVSFTILTKEKIGIIGRTGAGKSSLISVLFRLFDFDGTITIDGINIKSIPLQTLRSKISIIPQDPVLFIGSLRKNLDPFGEFSDDQLWKVLDNVELKQFFSGLPQGLESMVSEGGSNFSVGERQLLCLARTMLRKSKIIVLDEATANIDLKTDRVIQSTIKRRFRDCTVLTIAHRLDTVLGSDKILVMESGSVVEFGRPEELLQNPKGHFCSYFRNRSLVK